MNFTTADMTETSDDRPAEAANADRPVPAAVCAAGSGAESQPGAACAVQQASSGGVFPLPLSEFEHYMLTDDRPTHPMVIVMLVDGRGQLQEPLFRQAVTDLVQAHPLLHARVQRRAGQLEWVAVAASPQALPASVSLEWHAETTTDPQLQLPAVRSLNIEAGESLRLQVWRGRQAGVACFRVVLEVHHACADGIAAVQLIAELLARYGQLEQQGLARQSAVSDGAQPQFEAPRSELLPGRATLAESGSGEQDRGHVSGRGRKGSIVGKLWRLFARRPVRLASSRERSRRSGSAGVSGVSASVQPHPAILLQTLGAELTSRLGTLARARGVTVNDLLLMVCLQQARAWNAAAGLARPRKWIRIAVPISMRTARSSGLPACNRVSYALVTHRMRECDEPKSLLARIHDKTAGLMTGREGAIAWKLFRALRRIPGGLRCMLSWWSCAGTLVLANVGDIRRRTRARFPQQGGYWQAGSVVVERITGVSPVRPNTLAAIGVAEYGGRMTISLRTDGTMLNREDSELFLSQFCERLAELD